MDVTRRSDVGNGLDRHAIVVKLEGPHPDRQLLMRLQSSEALVGSIMPAAADRKATPASRQRLSCA